MTELNDFIKDFTDDVKLQYHRICQQRKIAKNDMFTRGKVQRLAMSIVAQNYGIIEKKVYTQIQF